jgi:hypothetical protein
MIKPYYYISLQENDNLPEARRFAVSRATGARQIVRLPYVEQKTTGKLATYGKYQGRHTANKNPRQILKKAHDK